MAIDAADSYDRTTERGMIARLIFLPHLIRERHEVVVDHDEHGREIRVLPVRYLNPLRPPYPELPLREREVVAVTRSPLLFLWIPIFLIVPLGLTFASWLSVEASNPETPALLRQWYWSPLVAALTLLGMYMLYVHWWANAAYITARSITMRHNWLMGLKFWSVVPNDIHGLKERTWFPALIFGRLLGFGSVIIQGPSGNGQPKVLRGVANYEWVMSAAECVNKAPDEAAMRNVELSRRQLQAEERVNATLEEIRNLLQHQSGTNPIGLVREVAEFRERTDTLIESHRILFGLLNLSDEQIADAFGPDLLNRLKHIGALPGTTDDGNIIDLPPDDGPVGRAKVPPRH